MDMEKLLISIETCRKDHVKRDNTFTEGVLAMAYKKLKEYKDLKEQGLLLEFPCKVGDKVYKIYDDVYEFEVTCIYINENGARMVAQCKELNLEMSLDMNSFSEVFYLTKAEAEKKLEEMEK